MIKKLLFIGLSLLILTACQLGPRHCVPSRQLPKSWVAEEEGDKLQATAPQPLAALFNDPKLSGYLRRLAAENTELRQAAARIQQAIALRQVSAARLMPFVDGRVAFNQSKPAGGVLSGTDPDGSALGEIPLNIRQLTFLADFDALWEIDLFGKRQKEVEASTAYLCMEAASYEDLLISLSAEFTRTYLELSKQQRLLELIKEEVVLLQQKSRAAKERLFEGLDSELATLDQQIELNRLAAERPAIEAEISALIYRLAFMLGQPPAALSAELSAPIPIPITAQTIAIGYPSELLRRRPDIRYAERQLARATAEVGVAVAELFPSLTLTGSYGFQIIHLGDTKGSGPSFGYGTNLLAPLFHGGSLRANLKRYRSLRNEACIAYEEAVIGALEDAESSLARFLSARRSESEIDSLLASSRSRLNLAEQRFSSGLIGCIEVFDERLKALKAEREAVEARVKTKTQMVALYKALGGNLDG